MTDQGNRRTQRGVQFSGEATAGVFIGVGVMILALMFGLGRHDVLSPSAAALLGVGGFIFPVEVWLVFRVGPPRRGPTAQRERVEGGIASVLLGMLLGGFGLYVMFRPVAPSVAGSAFVYIGSGFIALGLWGVRTAGQARR